MQSVPPSGKQKSKAYLSSVAIQSDATKYRQKYKELKRKVREIEGVRATADAGKRQAPGDDAAH